MNELLVPGGLLSLLLVGGLLLAWRRTGRREVAQSVRVRLNVTLYQEHLDDLDASLADGSIDDARYQQLKTDLDRRLLVDTETEGAEPVSTRAPSWVVVGVLLFLPVAAVLLYGQLGAASAVKAMSLVETLRDEPEGPRREALIARLVDELENGTGDEAEGFRYLLANLYLEQDRAQDAVEVLTVLSEHYPGDGELLGLLFRARYQAEGKVSDELRALADRALQLNPSQTGLLGLLGMASFQSADYAGAVRYWERLLTLVPADSDHANIIRQGVNQARMQLGEEPLLAASPSGPPAGENQADTVSVTAAAIQVSVSLADGMTANPDDTVFVFAKAVSGPPMPLAVARLRAGDLPQRVQLDDSMAMSPALKLSGFSHILVTARISRHGSVQAQAGDLEGQSQTLELGPEGAAVDIVIDRRVAES